MIIRNGKLCKTYFQKNKQETKNCARGQKLEEKVKILDVAAKIKTDHLQLLWNALYNWNITRNGCAGWNKQGREIAKQNTRFVVEKARREK